MKPLDSCRNLEVVTELPQTWSGGLEAQRDLLLLSGRHRTLSPGGTLQGGSRGSMGSGHWAGQVQLQNLKPRRSPRWQTSPHLYLLAPWAVYLSWPSCLCTGWDLSASPCASSKPAYPSKSSLNPILSVIISPKHLSQNRSELAALNKTL